MSTDLFWLTASVAMTALFWVPYVLNRMAVRGLMGAMANPSPDDAPQSPWAVRAQAAHVNAVENLVIYAPLVLAIELLQMNSAATAIAGSVYFFARLAHFIVYTAGLPILRTGAFTVAWAVQIYLALTLFGWV